MKMTTGPVHTGDAPVNGVVLYYEIHGTGQPLILLHGDADSIPPAHAARFFALLGGGQADAGWDGSNMLTSQLAILPGTTHYNIFASPAMASTIIPFLDAPLREKQ